MTGHARGMRVLWLSHWMRPLARIYAESLIGAGADVLLVTSDQHPSSGPARPYEVVLDPRPKTARTWPQFARAAPQVHRFAPDVVVAELVRDPRWLAFAPGVPRVEIVHDDRPHDTAIVTDRADQCAAQRRSLPRHRGPAVGSTGAPSPARERHCAGRSTTSSVR